MRFSGWSIARPMPTPCTRRAAGPRRRRASARPSRCRPSASPNTRCCIPCRASGIATCSWPPPSVPRGRVAFRSAKVRRALGAVLLTPPTRPTEGLPTGAAPETFGQSPWLGRRPATAPACHAVAQRATQTLKWVERQRDSLLDIALDHLTLGRAALYAAILQESPLSNLKSEIEQAVSGLRRAGQQHHLPHGLLTRAGCGFSRRSQPPAPERRRATWTKPGKSPSADRCRCSSPTSICTGPGCSGDLRSARVARSGDRPQQEKDKGRMTKDQ